MNWYCQKHLFTMYPAKAYFYFYMYMIAHNPQLQTACPKIDYTCPVSIIKIINHTFNAPYCHDTLSLQTLFTLLLIG